MSLNKIALVQMTSTSNFQSNLESSLSYIKKARENNAQLIAFPENFLLIGSKKQYQNLDSIIKINILEVFQKAAYENTISILLGSIYEKDEKNSQKLLNSSFLIDQTGKLLAKYTKIHLFDISLKEFKYKETELISPGENIVTCSHAIGKIGLSICYDIRFPGLYQKLTNKGAEIVFVPAAFTVPTGKAHWLTLLRARAIENQVFIAAPAQFGHHSETRESFGNSVIIDPWGEIIVKADDREEIIYGDIDLARLHDIRKRMPVQEHQVQGIDF